jgi:mannose-6-phosphate isomerase-like protein (cupin superfamily)
MLIDSRSTVVVPPGEGLGLWSVGDLLTLKVREQHTAGDFVLAEALIPPGGGPPPHIHLREDEMFYVLEGQISFVFDDKTFVAGPGKAVFLPRGKVHTFANRTSEPARALVWASPSNFERFMLEFGVPLTDSPLAPAPDADMMARLARAAERYGLVMLPQHKPAWVIEPPAEPERLAVLGTRIGVRLTGRTSQDRMCLAELDVRAGTGVVPHLHRREDELFYVLSGEFEIEVDGINYSAPTGTTVYVPRGTFHSFNNVGCTIGRLLSMHTPAGFEHFIAEMSAYSEHGMEIPESDVLVELLDKHGMDVPAELALVG